MFADDRDPVIERKPPVLDVVVSARDAARLDPFVQRLHRRLDSHLPGAFRITLVCNEAGATARVVHRLAGEIEGVRVVSPDRGGRGRAVRTAWSGSTALVLAHVDVDRPGDLDTLPSLVGPLLVGEADLAVDVRSGPAGRVLGEIERLVVSRCYSLVLRGTVRTRVADARFGVRAVRGDTARRLLPLTDESGRFFHTELLVLAERAGLRPGWAPAIVSEAPGPAGAPAPARAAAVLRAYADVVAPPRPATW